MKTILIIIIFSLTNPNEPAMLVHRSYPTETSCEANAAAVQAKLVNDDGIRTMTYCIKSSDLTE